MSLCATRNLSDAEGALTYRFGRPGRIELTYPETVGLAKNLFRGGLLRTEGDFVQFSRGDVTYSVEYADGPRVDHYAGVRVFRRGKQVANLQCRLKGALGPEGFGPIHRANLPRGDYGFD